MLLEDARAEHERDRRHRDAVVVVGEPDDEIRIALAQCGDDREVEILDVRRVRGGAVQHAQLLVRDEDRVHGAIDVLERPTAGRQEHRLAERGDVPEERDVQEIAGRELERIDVRAPP